MDVYFLICISTEKSLKKNILKLLNLVIRRKKASN